VIPDDELLLDFERGIAEFDEVNFLRDSNGKFIFIIFKTSDEYYKQKKSCVSMNSLFQVKTTCVECRLFELTNSTLVCGKKKKHTTMKTLMYMHAK
jgi:hypothetical protein